MRRPLVWPPYTKNADGSWPCSVGSRDVPLSMPLVPLAEGEQGYEERYGRRVFPVDPREGMHPNPSVNPPYSLWALIAHHGSPHHYGWMTTESGGGEMATLDIVKSPGAPYLIEFRPAMVVEQLLAQIADLRTQLDACTASRAGERDA